MNLLAYAGNKALYLVVALSAIPIMVATFVGLTVALIQAITHLQEQTLPFGIKLLAVSMCVYLMMGWISSRLIVFGEEVFRIAFSI